MFVSVLSSLLFIIFLEVLSRDVRLGSPDEKLYEDIFAVVCESFEELKGKPEA